MCATNSIRSVAFHVYEPVRVIIVISNIRQRRSFASVDDSPRRNIVFFFFYRNVGRRRDGVADGRWRQTASVVEKS